MFGQSVLIGTLEKLSIVRVRGTINSTRARKATARTLLLQAPPGSLHQLSSLNELLATWFILKRKGSTRPKAIHTHGPSVRAL